MAILDYIVSGYKWFLALPIYYVIGGSVVAGLLLLCCCYCCCKKCCGCCSNSPSSYSNSYKDNVQMATHSNYSNNNNNNYSSNNTYSNNNYNNNHTRKYSGSSDKSLFSIATPNNRNLIMTKLRNITPSGSTALRDAVALGIYQMIQLKSVLAQAKSEQLNRYKFLHIVLTDGQDTSSKLKLEQLGGIFLQLGIEVGDLCKTYYIGVDLDYTAAKELAVMSALGQQSCDVMNCSQLEIKQIFERIIVNLGVMRQTAILTDGQNALIAQRDQAVIDIDINYFLVLFTLDISGSMGGSRWTNVCAAVDKFLEYLKPPDLVGVTTFNHEPKPIYGVGL